MSEDHKHVELPSGAVATIAEDCPPETLKALDAMAEAAKRAALNGKLNCDTIHPPRKP